MDFKGNIIESRRQLSASWQNAPDWTDLSEETTESGWDTEGALLLESEAYVSTATFDALDRPVTMTTPAESGRPASTHRYGYDRGGRLAQTWVTLRGGTEQPVVTEVTYNARGQRRTFVAALDDDGALRRTYVYDPETFQLVNLISATYDEFNVTVSDAQDLTYTYDPVGNVVRIDDEAQETVFLNNETVTPERTFVYDALYRLTTSTGREHAPDLVSSQYEGVLLVAAPGSGSLTRYSEQFTYDDAGNMIELGHLRTRGSLNSGWTRLTPVAEGSNRIASVKFGSDSVVSLTHDPFGNLLAVPGLEAMSWDAFGMLHLTQPMTGGTDRTFYVYDATGNRVRKVSEQRTNSESPWARVADTAYLGGFELARKWMGSAGDDLDDEIETVHLMDGESRIALIETQTVEDEDPVTTPTPKWRFQLDDRLGSACLEIARDGTVISYEEYHAYGSTALHIADSSFSPRRYRWSGKERDPESGLVYFGARYLAPWMGRWVSADPAGAADGNAYRVVRGNPVSLREVDGRQGASIYDIEDYPYDARSSTTIEEARELRAAVPAGPGLPRLVGELVGGAIESAEEAAWGAAAVSEVVGNPAGFGWRLVTGRPLTPRTDSFRTAATGSADGTVTSRAGVALGLNPDSGAWTVGFFGGAVAMTVVPVGRAIGVADDVARAVSTGTARATRAGTAEVAGGAGGATARASTSVADVVGDAARGNGSAANRALHERYVDGLRAAMERPHVHDAGLSRIMDGFYRPGATVGSGSTAAAVRHEMATGARFGGRLHTQKAHESITRLQRWLDRNLTARSGDRAAAENVLRDLQNALGGH